MSDLDYKDYKEDISYLGIETCTRCGKSPMSPIARVNSLHFANFIYYLLRCENPSCNADAWVVLDRNEVGKRQLILATITKKPKPPNPELVPYRTTISSYLELPENVFHDFDQAYNCFLAEFYDAAVCMARRALDRVLVDKGAKQSDNIPRKIEQLEKQGKLPPETSLLCDDIRDFGKKGAHTYEPTTAKDADYAIIWTDIIIAWLYGHIEPVSNEFKS